MDDNNWVHIEDDIWTRGRWQVCRLENEYVLTHEDLIVGGECEQWRFVNDSSVPEQCPDSIRHVISDFYISLLFGLTVEGHKDV